MKMIERPARAITLEFTDIDFAREAELFELFVEFGAVLIVHFFFDAIGAKACDFAPRVKLGLVKRVAKGFANIPQHGDRTRLRHEGRHRPDGALYDNIDALHRNAATARRVA